MIKIGITELVIGQKDQECKIEAMPLSGEDQKLPATIEMKMPEGSRTLMEVVNPSGFSIRGVRNTWIASQETGIPKSAKSTWDKASDQFGFVLHQKKDRNGK